MLPNHIPILPVHFSGPVPCSSHSIHRLLEINGCDVSSKTHQEVGEVLQQCHGAVKLVVGRLQPPFGAIGGSLNDLYGVESPKGMVIERFKKLNASLSAQLDLRSAEVEQWRQESER